jgi:hypothetical protein
MESKTSKFIYKANILHDGKYEYSMVSYKHSKDKVKIMCLEHGVFEQTPNSHLKGSGCPICNKNNTKANKLFVCKANEKHKNKYDYSLVDYINNKVKIKILCTIHGEFEQTPYSHLTGCGCPKCGSNKLNNCEFIVKSVLVHENKYNYSLVNYINSKIKVKILCPIHGEFEQIPNHHLNGSGCSVCKESKGEREIKKYLNDNDIIFIRQKRFPECKDKKPLPFDFYLPEFNTCVEFNGRQHYSSIPYWGGDKNFEKQQNRDNIKFNFCIKNNIELIIINEIKSISEKLKKIKWMKK